MFLIAISLSTAVSAWSWWGEDEGDSDNEIENDGANAGKANFANEQMIGVIQQPFLNLHTGPGRGYPVFYIARKNERVIVLKQRTGWVKVKIEDGTVGWAKKNSLALAFTPTGSEIPLANTITENTRIDPWEAGVLVGQLDSATVMSLFGGYQFTDNISVELSFAQVLGDFSESNWLNASLMHQPFPDWVASPYFVIGGGRVSISPKATLAQEKKRREDALHYGVGVRYDIDARYFLRMEYKEYIVFTDRDQNEDANEWKLGFGVHF